ncbi:hypothetical protein AWC38_SpisGene12271 [Stylophora pistillata]|uniref:Uncharacterized protein n=1 Tax=Stylophora pistillata TaxID=50429 RepID=A0A2B4S3S1_STYPI|nr:hypothetical protein AWC38_SpisGene12271 [Stylophora pistillata]
MILSGKKLALLMLLIVEMELLFCTIDASPWWRRRRRRRRSPPAITPPPPTPPPPPCNSCVPRLTIGGRAKKWVNAWQQSFRVYCPDASASFTYTCGSHGFITGIESDFNTITKDRRITVRCSHVKGYKYDNSDCENTGYKNVYEGLLNFRARPGYTVVGVVSQHSSRIVAGIFVSVNLKQARGGKNNGKLQTHKKQKKQIESSAGL